MYTEPCHRPSHVETAPLPGVSRHVWKARELSKLHNASSDYHRRTHALQINHEIEAAVSNRRRML